MGGGDHLAVRRERQVFDGTLRTFQRGELLARGYIPELGVAAGLRVERRAATCAYRLAVRREGDAQDVLGMATKGDELFACFELPKLRGLIEACRSQLQAVG